MSDQPESCPPSPKERFQRQVLFSTECLPKPRMPTSQLDTEHPRCGLSAGASTGVKNPREESSENCWTLGKNNIATKIKDIVDRDEVLRRIASPFLGRLRRRALGRERQRCDSGCDQSAAQPLAIPVKLRGHRSRFRGRSNATELWPRPTSGRPPKAQLSCASCPGCSRSPGHTRPRSSGGRLAGANTLPTKPYPSTRNQEPPCPA